MYANEANDLVTVPSLSATNVNATTVDTTNLEVTNLKAKDGTSAGSIADLTGVVSLVANPILSGGTANGVAYLNASKVLTTGSALTFDGTNLATTGTSTGVRLIASSTDAGGSVLQVDTTATAFGRVGGSTTMGYVAGTQSLWTIGGSEQMRLTSTGLGIGTSSPVAKITVLGAGTINAPETSTTGASIQTASYGITTRTGNLDLGATDALAANIGGSLTFSARYSGTNATWVTGKIGAYRDTATNGVASSYLSFATTTGAGDLTERMRLDSSGNLGLGVTPSASGSTYGGSQMRTLTVQSANITSAAGYDAFFSQNAYRLSDGSWAYQGNGGDNVAHLYGQLTGGAHAWYTAPSGTAGNAITFTQAMTLDASGNLGIGETSPGSYSKVVVRGGSGNFISYFGASTQTILGDNAGAAGQAGTVSNHPFLLITNGTERARIDSSGNLLVGTTSVLNSSVATLFKTATGPNQRVATFVNNGTSGSTTAAGIIISYPNAANGDGSTFIQCMDGNTDRFYVLGSGNVQNTNNSYGAISDAKLKENVTDATPKLEKLQQVRVVNYNLIGEEQKQIGVIAQELEQVFPGMVEEAVDRDTEGNDLGTTTKSVKYSVFVPMLIKAMQEQQAIIESMTARIAALEGASN